MNCKSACEPRLPTPTLHFMRDTDAEAKTILATPQRRPSRWRHVLRISLLLLASHGVAWGIGRAEGWWATRTVEEKADGLAKSLRDSKDLLLRFEALRLLSQASKSLEATNFGIAQQQVQEATRLLDASHPPQELVSLVATLGKYHPVVTENLAEQRQQLSGWLSQLDAQISKQQP